jgi:hypothetical protein
VIAPLAYMIQQVPYMRYVAVFVPVHSIISIMVAWMGAIFTFHVLKVLLRNSKIIK